MKNKNYFKLIEAADTVLSLGVLIFSIVIVSDVRNCRGLNSAGTTYGDLITLVCQNGLIKIISYSIIIVMFIIALFVLVSYFNKLVGAKK